VATQTRVTGAELQDKLQAEEEEEWMHARRVRVTGAELQDKLQAKEEEEWMHARRVLREGHFATAQVEALAYEALSYQSMGP
jgi:hypothetical protein